MTLYPSCREYGIKLDLPAAPAAAAGSLCIGKAGEIIVNGNVFAHLAPDAVENTPVKPFAGVRAAEPCTGTSKTVKEDGVDAAASASDAGFLLPLCFLLAVWYTCHVKSP